MVPDRVGFLLRQSEPYGAVVVDRAWDLQLMNAPMRTLSTWMLGSVPDAGNVVRMLFADDGLRPFLVNWEAVARSTLDRLYREAVTEGDDRLFALFEELLALPDVPASWRRMDGSRPPDIVMPVHLRKEGLDLRLFTTLTTLGTPTDVTSSELRIESYFPADEATDALVRHLVGAWTD